MLKSFSTLSAFAAKPAQEGGLQEAENSNPWRAMLLGQGWPTLHYLTQTEAHTFAFSVAANAILSFFPFVLLMMWLVLNVFHSRAMFDVIGNLLKYQLPAQQDYVVRNIAALAQTRHSVNFTSVIILLVSSSGVFLPLEVAFNQIWGFAKNRSYIGNQLISFVLAFACGTLGLISVSLATGNYLLLAFVMGGHTDNIIFRALAFVLMKVFSMLATVAIFFLIYWLLPNGKVPAKKVLRASVVVGLVWEAAKYIYILALPWLGFREVYGPFTIAVTLMVWAFVSGLLVLAGAHLVASPPGASGPPVEPPLPALYHIPAPPPGSPD